MKRSMASGWMMSVALVTAFGCSGEQVSQPQQALPSVSQQTTQTRPQQRPSATPELSKEEWARKDAKARADVEAANINLKETADSIEQNLGKIRQDLEVSQKKADAEREAADKKTIEKLDAETERIPKK